MVAYIWVNIDSGNDLSPDDTMPEQIPERMLTYRQ